MRFNRESELYGFQMSIVVQLVGVITSSQVPVTSRNMPGEIAPAASAPTR